MDDQSELFTDIRNKLIAQKRAPEDIQMIEKAFEFAKKLHQGQ